MKQKSLLNSSLRRIGEVCAASLTGTHSYPLKLSQRDHVFCSSCDIKIRVLSCLLILQTISQGMLQFCTACVLRSSDFAVDAVNLALQNLKCDLRQTGVSCNFDLYLSECSLLCCRSKKSSYHLVVLELCYRMLVCPLNAMFRVVLLWMS